MTTLVVDELKTTLSQTVIVTEEKRFLIEAIRPYIYMHNAPSGTFTLSLKSGATTLASNDFTSADIKSDLSTTNNYAHIWKTLELDNPVQLGKGSYELELSSTGYAFGLDSFMGWVKEHENQFNEVTGTAPSDLWGSYSYQLLNYVEAK